METTQVIGVVCALGCLNICWGFVSSIQAPFFPVEAQKKGASASQFGPIFGIIHLALFLISPLVGKLVTKAEFQRISYICKSSKWNLKKHFYLRSSQILNLHLNWYTLKSNNSHFLIDFFNEYTIYIYTFIMEILTIEQKTFHAPN